MTGLLVLVAAQKAREREREREREAHAHIEELLRRVHSSASQRACCRQCMMALMRCKAKLM
jgi:hypothetical protein